MDSTGQFLKKRYGRTFGFALPIILACIGTGMLLNYLEARGASRQTLDGVGAIGIATILIVSTLTIVLRRPLPGPLGRWQKLWQSIPTWRERRAEQPKTEPLDQPPA